MFGKPYADLATADKMKVFQRATEIQNKARTAQQEGPLSKAVDETVKNLRAGGGNAIGIPSSADPRFSTGSLQDEFSKAVEAQIKPAKEELSPKNDIVGSITGKANPIDIKEAKAMLGSRATIREILAKANELQAKRASK